MKKTLLLFALLISALSNAQGTGDVTIYSNTGAKFYVILNGIRQNQQAETNVKVTGLNNNWYSCKVIAEDNTFEIEKNVGVKFDTLTTYRILEKKGKYKLRFYSETSLGTNTATPNQTVIVYHSTDTPTTSTQVTPIESSTISTSTTTVTNTGNTQTTINEGGNGTETINMNVNIGENGMNANVNITGTGITTPVEQESITTTTTTTTSSSNSSNINGSTYYEESTTTSGNGTTTTTYYEETSSTGGTNNTIQNNNFDYDNCYTSDTDVKSMQTQIENESFEDDQLRVANLAAKNKCMSVAQIKSIANTFTFSDNKLSFIKTAYNNCTDQSNYYQLLEVLTFSDDKEALETFINSKK